VYQMWGNLEVGEQALNEYLLSEQY